LIVGPSGPGRTTYAAYNPVTRIISGFEGMNSDANSYTEEFTDDLSGEISANLTPLLFDSFFGPFGPETIITVFDDPQEEGSVIAMSDVGVSPETNILNIDLESPTDMLLLTRGLSEDVFLVSPTSEFAVYIRDSNLNSQSVELIEIGTGFDQVSFPYSCCV